MDDARTESEEQELKPKDSKALCLKWLKEIDTVLNSKEQRAFERVGERIVKKYRNADALQIYDTNTGSARVMLNVLWVTVQIKLPVLYARMPKVVVEREFKDKDPVGRVAAMGAERATSSILRAQQDRFNYAAKGAVQERLTVGRGQVWLRYTSQQDEQGMLVPLSEKVIVDPLNWQDYLESFARNQYEVRWRARLARMTRQALVNRFGEEIGNAVKFTGDGERKRIKDDEQEIKQADVWEIWDDETKQVVWVSKGYQEGVLDVKPDPMRLENFFPCPLPLLATTTTDTTYPTPDFKIYEKLADEVDYTTKRIASIMDCIRIVGGTAAQLNNDLKNMLKLSDGQLWPMENWATFAERGGFKGSIDWMPIEQAVSALPALMQYQEHCLNIIFEQIVGLPDIMRGASDPNDTVEAQQQKGRWASIRVSDQQADVQRFCRQIVEKVAEILFEPGLFSDQTLSVLAGVDQFSPEDQALWPEALALLRNDRLRTFRVDIETDSTIAMDEATEKAERTEFLSAITGLFGQVQNVVQFSPDLMKPMLESALFAARAFRAGRALEGAFEQAIDRILEAQNAPPPEPPPDYEGQKLQIEAQKVQGQMQIEMNKLQLDSQKSQANIQVELQKLELEARRIMSEEQAKAFDAQLDKFKEDFKQFAETQRLQIEKFSAIASEREAILEEARLKQDQILQAAEMRQNKMLKDVEVIAAKQPAQAPAPIVTVIQPKEDDSEKEIDLVRTASGFKGKARKVKRGEQSNEGI